MVTKENAINIVQVYLKYLNKNKLITKIEIPIKNLNERISWYQRIFNPFLKKKIKTLYREVTLFYVVMENDITETKHFWIIPINTNLYKETKDPSYIALGMKPLLVSKKTKKIYKAVNLVRGIDYTDSQYEKYLAGKLSEVEKHLWDHFEVRIDELNNEERE